MRNRTNALPRPGASVRFGIPDTRLCSNRTANRTASEREPDNEPDTLKPDTLHAHEPDNRTAKPALRVDGDGGPYFGEVFDGWTFWHRSTKGGTAVVMPAPRPEWSAELQALYAARVVANMTQRCPVCGSEDVSLTATAPRRATGTLTHEAGCPVGDAA